MQTIIHQGDKLNPLSHAKAMLRIRETKEVALAPLSVSQGFGYSFVVDHGKTLTLRMLDKTKFVVDGKAYDQVKVSNRAEVFATEKGFVCFGDVSGVESKPKGKDAEPKRAKGAKEASTN